MAFLLGIPREAAGPVVEKLTPMVTSCASAQMHAAKIRNTEITAVDRFILFPQFGGKFFNRYGSFLPLV